MVIATQSLHIDARRMVDRAAGDFQVPVAGATTRICYVLSAGVIVTGGHVGVGQRGQGVDKVRAVWPRTDITAIQQQVPIGSQRVANGCQLRRVRI